MRKTLMARMQRLLTTAATLSCLLATATHADESVWTPEVLEQYEQTALTGSLRDLADFSAEVAPLDEVRIFGELALIYAARNFEPDRLEVIIKSHTSLDIKDETGTTAVMHALMAGRIDNAELLHAWQAPLAGVNNAGWTVRTLAEEVGLKNFGPEPIASFPAPDIPPQDLADVLLLAAEAGDTPLIDWTLSLGADLGVAAQNGLQALHLAALGGHEDTFTHLVNHPQAPANWATLTGAPGQAAPMTIADFIIAGEGGGDHVRAGRMLARALQTPTLAAQITPQADKYRTAMMTLGYPLDIVRAHFGFPDLPAWDIGIPTWSDTSGGTREEWRAVQRMLRAEGLYTSDIDGVPGGGTQLALIEHAVRHLPDLIARIDLLQAMAEVDASETRVQWESRADGRWSLSELTAEDGGLAPLGYLLDLPKGAERVLPVSFGTPGHLYGYRSLTPSGLLTHPVMFSVGPTSLLPQDSFEQGRFAYLRLVVFKRYLHAIFTDDGIEYFYEARDRRYSAPENPQWIEALKGRLQ